MIELAKRINNNKRGYLMINTNQGKHKIALINNVINEYDALAKKAEKLIKNALVIGFAETAVAIGARVASKEGTFFMQTTRENVMDNNADYINFLEIHSHATMQRLIKTDMEKIYNKVERIVFVEDEITTGNTIWHAIKKIEDIFKCKKKYAIVSLINSLTDERKKFFKEGHIDIISLSDIDHTGFENDVKDILEDGKVYSVNKPKVEVTGEIIFKTEVRTRRLTDMRVLDGEIRRLEYYLEERYELKNILEGAKSITVLGSEEFTYVPIKLAEYIDLMTGNETEVYTHSTTRSPIAVSKKKDYPLHVRYEVKSLYDKNRRTYVYDLMKSDILFLVTDGDDKVGMKSVLEAIKLSGNEKVYIIRWSNE